MSTIMKLKLKIFCKNLAKWQLCNGMLRENFLSQPITILVATNLPSAFVGTFYLSNRQRQFPRCVLLKKYMSLYTRSLRVLNNWDLRCILQFKWIKKLNFPRVFLTFGFELLFRTILQKIFWSHAVKNRETHTSSISFDT